MRPCLASIFSYRNKRCRNKRKNGLPRGGSSLWFRSLARLSECQIVFKSMSNRVQIVFHIVTSINCYGIRSSWGRLLSYFFHLSLHPSYITPSKGWSLESPVLCIHKLSVSSVVVVPSYYRSCYAVIMNEEIHDPLAPKCGGVIHQLLDRALAVNPRYVITHWTVRSRLPLSLDSIPRWDGFFCSGWWQISDLLQKRRPEISAVSTYCSCWTRFVRRSCCNTRSECKARSW